MRRKLPECVWSNDEAKTAVEKEEVACQDVLGTRKVIMKEKRMGIDKEERRMYILRVKRRGRNGGKMKRWKDCNSIRNRTRRG